MRELLVDPEDNLLDGRDAQNVDFHNCSIIGPAQDHPRRVGQRMGFDVLDWLSRKLSSTGGVQPRFTSRVRTSESRYHAVSIRAGDPCCEAARQFGQLRILSAKAPSLPLPGCDVATCTCRYAHYSDRRSGTDRRAVYDLDRERDAEFVNRRRNHGRRSTDARVWSGNSQA